MTSQRLLLSALLFSACSTAPQTDTTVREIRGQLDTSQFNFDDAHVILRSTNRHTWRTPVDSDGRFQITVPTNRTYTVRFANATTTANYYDAFAYLQFRTGSGAVVRNVRVTPGAPIELGRVFPTTGSQSQGLRAASNDDDDDDDGMSSDEDGDDADDDAIACDDDDGAAMVPADSENDMMADVDSDHDGVSDDEDADACDDDSDDDDDHMNGTSTSSISDDDDDDDDDETQMSCEDPAEEIEDECGEDSSAGTVDCAMNPSDPACL